MKLDISNTIYITEFTFKNNSVDEEAKKLEDAKWLKLKIDNNYQILNYYPYPIKRIKDGKIMKDIKRKSSEYINIKIGDKEYRKHFLIASQFISNPKNLEIVDHINHKPNDNHISNLRWVTYSENNMNKKSHLNFQYEFFDQLPQNSIQIKNYEKYQFNNLYYCNKEFYVYNGIKYRKLINSKNFILPKDIENKTVKLNITKLKRLHNIDD